MPAKGQIVVFLRGDQPAAGVVDEQRAGTPVVVTADGKRLQAQSVLAAGPASQGQPREAARSWDRRLAEAAASISVAEIWELLEGSSGMTLSEIEEAWLGPEAGFEERASLIVALWSDRVHFERRKDRLIPEPRARIEERLARQRDHARKAERIESLSEAVRAVADGGPFPPDVDPDDRERLASGLRDLAVHGPEVKGAGEILEVLRRAGLNAADAPFDLLVAMGELHPDENLDLIRHSIRASFPDDVLAEAGSVLEALASGSWHSGREDMTGLHCVTIDSERTVEVDDALSVRLLERGWEIGVHIADLSELLPPRGAVMREALARGSSLYTPDATIPMLPPILGRDGFSLDAERARPAMSLVARVDEQGNTLDWRFTRSVVSVSRRLSYEQADELATSGDPVLGPLARAGRALFDRRIAAGGVDLRFPELEVRVDPDGIHVRVTRGSSPSHVLVSECAILANTLAARFLHERGVAAVFRTQPKPEGELPDTATGGPAAELAARRMLGSTAYTTEPGLHFTLGVEAYTLMTSPIRRVFDILVQRQLAAALLGTEPLARVDLDRALLTAAPAAETLSRIERSRTQYWLLRHLDAHAKGSLLRGVVVDLGADRVLVHLPDYAMQVPLRTRDPSSFRKGEEIQVRLDRADARRDIVRISPVR